MPMRATRCWLYSWVHRAVGNSMAGQMVQRGTRALLGYGRLNKGQERGSATIYLNYQRWIYVLRLGQPPYSSWNVQ